VRDEELKEQIQEVYTSNYRVYGARKIWRELNRQGHAVARCTVERLMREVGITGAVRGKKVITTITDPSAERAPDLLDRDFVASAPNRCWVADFTHVAAWSGIVYVAFVVDTFSRRIVGWSASTSKETQLVLDALEMALWQRDREGRPHTPGQLIHHSDAGSQPGLKWSSQHRLLGSRVDVRAHAGDSARSVTVPFCHTVFANIAGRRADGCHRSSDAERLIKAAQSGRTSMRLRPGIATNGPDTSARHRRSSDRLRSARRSVKLTAT
jgi:putative transposase